MTPYKPYAYDSSQNYELDSLDNFKDLNILSMANNVANKVANTPATNILNQENQDYYSRLDQQYIGCKYDGGLEQVTIELVPDIILEEEEDGLINGLTGMINGIIHPTHRWKKMTQGVPTYLILTIVFSTSQRSNKMGH